MSNVIEFDHSIISDLYDQLHHLDLTFVKHGIFQMYHLFGSPSPRLWANENQAFGVFVVYYKLAKNLSRMDFIRQIQAGKIEDETKFTLDEKNLIFNGDQLRFQANQLHRYLDTLADEFDYEVWLLQSGLYISFQR
ncbi:MAG: hypothetical protein HRU19_25915 [Pseudobacteriovorax sp.]|nr:hypothetical protein [Pseudobacteriovorax sp.]